MTNSKVALVEIFAAPQGEGYNTGRWSVFVRLAGCPLACEFAPGVVCDTPYQHANFKVPVAEILRQAQALAPPTAGVMSGRPMLVLTGGEPTASPRFDEIVYGAIELGYYVAIETNGMKWRQGLGRAHWITVSPKDDVPQTSSAPLHNKHPTVAPQVATRVRDVMAYRRVTGFNTTCGGEYRYVITADSPKPAYWPAPRHYLSPAVASDGSGEEWKKGFPGFAPKAVDRCLEIIDADPRWRISVQMHKMIGVR